MRIRAGSSGEPKVIHSVSPWAAGSISIINIGHPSVGLRRKGPIGVTEGNQRESKQISVGKHLATDFIHDLPECHSRFLGVDHPAQKLDSHWGGVLPQNGCQGGHHHRCPVNGPGPGNGAGETNAGKGDPGVLLTLGIGSIWKRRWTFSLTGLILFLLLIGLSLLFSVIYTNNM